MQGRRGTKQTNPHGDPLWAHPPQCLQWAPSGFCTRVICNTPLRCSCLENPRDGVAWRAAVYGVAQSRTWLKWLSSSSNLQHTQVNFFFLIKVECFLGHLQVRTIHLPSCWPWKGVLSSLLRGILPNSKMSTLKVVLLICFWVLCFEGSSLLAQMVKDQPAVQETWMKAFDFIP